MLDQFAVGVVGMGRLDEQVDTLADVDHGRGPTGGVEVPGVEGLEQEVTDLAGRAPGPGRQVLDHLVSPAEEVSQAGLVAGAPRRVSDRVIDREMTLGVVFVGMVMALVTLLTLDIGLPGGLIEGSGTLTEARTLAFTTLVLAQLFNCFNARSGRVSAFHHLFTNPLLWAAIALSAVLQVAVVYVPLLNDAFETAPLGITDWLQCTAMASIVHWADEVRKLVSRRRGSRAISTGTSPA